MPRPARITAGLLTLVLVPMACEKPRAATPATRPATRPAATSAPASQPVAVEKPPADVLAVVRLDDPNYPTKSPLDFPADLADAAKIILKRPAMADAQGNLWLGHPAGRRLDDALSAPPADRTVVCRSAVDWVARPDDGGPASAVFDRTFVAVPTRKDDPPRVQFRGRVRSDIEGSEDGTGPQYWVDEVAELADADFRFALPFDGGVAVPTAGAARGAGVVLFSPDLRTHTFVGLGGAGPTVDALPVLANAGNGVWAWRAATNDDAGSPPVYLDAAGPHPADAAAGWPAKLVEIVPLADGSVLAIGQGDGTPELKLIQTGEKRPDAALLKTIEPLARQLADPDPLRREAAQRQLEQQGPAAYPVLETLREQLPPEAQVRIETLLGQRFAPTLGGLRPLPGKVTTLARFPGGGCVLRLDGGGTVDDDAGPRTVIPATVLIRPGRFIELFDPTAVCDFVPGRNTIQWVGGELLIGGPKKGLLRVVGRTAQPLLPPNYADFDTVKAIDARRRWLLTGTKRPGETLLIDPSLPDTTPKLPTWTLAAGGVGRTDDGYVALKRGDRLFVLDRNGWRVDAADKLRPPPVRLPAAFDPDGNLFAVSDAGIDLTDRDGGHASATLPDADAATLVASDRLLLAYTPDGKVRRYATGAGPTLTLEATFSQGVPRAADAVWLDPAGRLVMVAGNEVTVGFPDGRIPGKLKDLMMNVER